MTTRPGSRCRPSRSFPAAFGPLRRVANTTVFAALAGITFGAGMLAHAVFGGGAAMAAPPLSAPVAAGQPAPCDRWETAFAPPGTGVSPMLPKLGVVMSVKGPEGGWEPFAFASNGQLVFRRCVPDKK